MGVPSITSNLTGFANFISRRVADPESNGLFIVDRRFKAFAEGKHQMANIMWRYCQLTRRQRIAVCLIILIVLLIVLLLIPHSVA